LSESEPRLIGAAAVRWLKRFDIQPDELMTYKFRLLNEPQLDVPSL